MRSKQKKIRLAVSGLLLAAVVGTGIYAYQADQNYVEELKEQNSYFIDALYKGE